MRTFCARLLVICLVNNTKPRKRCTCDYPFVLIRAKSHEGAFEQALELGKKQEAKYKNSKGQWVRWAFVQVEEIRQLPRSLAGVEVGSLLDVLIADKPISFRRRFNSASHPPLFT